MLTQTNRTRPDCCLLSPSLQMSHPCPLFSKPKSHASQTSSVPHSAKPSSRRKDTTSTRTTYKVLLPKARTYTV